MCSIRRCFADLGYERIHCGTPSLDVDDDAVTRVPHPAFQIEARRQPIDERSKTDALDGARYPDETGRLHGLRRLRSHITSPSAHADLVNLIVFDEDRYQPLPARQLKHAFERGGILVHIVFLKLTTSPLEVLPHLRGVTAGFRT